MIQSGFLTLGTLLVLCASSIAQETTKSEFEPIVLKVDEPASTEATSESKLDTCGCRPSFFERFQHGLSPRMFSRFPCNESCNGIESSSDGQNDCGSQNGLLSRIGRGHCWFSQNRGCGKMRCSASACGSNDERNSNACCEDYCNECRRYWSVYGGANYVHDYNGEIFPQTYNGTFRDGFMIGGAVGRYIKPNVRAEIDSTYRQNSGDTWTGFGVTPFDGRLQNYSLMFNLLREFGDGRIKRYAGGGVGAAYSDAEFNVAGTLYDISSGAFAYQAIAGISVMQQNGNEFFTEYRFYGNTAVDLTNVPAATVTDFVYLSHSVVFGIRMSR